MNGWAFCKTSQKIHYFRGERSLCGKWKPNGNEIIVAEADIPIKRKCKECHNRKVRWGA